MPDRSVASAIRRHGVRWAAVLAVLALAACHSAGRTSPTGAQPKAPPPSATAAPAIKPAAALFYTKAGSLYVSEPAGTPGRKLTDGPIDTQPAPSPDLSHVAFVRKTAASQYGGELWVLDLSPQLAPAGPPRRLVSPATLPRGTGDSAPMVVSPRWSPTGQHVAFVDNENAGMVNGGILLVVASDTGALLPQKQPLLAESSFVWAPDGSHIAWVDARSDVSPVDINALAVGSASTPVATDTNAYSVTYGKNGQTILFTNGNASGPDFAAIPFAVRTGGIYSVSASTEPGAEPSVPTPLFTKQGSYYGDIAALESGAVAFTAQGADTSSKTIQVLDAGSPEPRATATDVATAVQGPAWGAGDSVAYIGTSPETPLLVTDLDNHTAKVVDTGVDSFAWAPASR